MRERKGEAECGCRSSLQETHHLSGVIEVAGNREFELDRERQLTLFSSFEVTIAVSRVLNCRKHL
jgi:hypothetical protein